MVIQSMMTYQLKAGLGASWRLKTKEEKLSATFLTPQNCICKAIVKIELVHKHCQSYTPLESQAKHLVKTNTSKRIPSIVYSKKHKALAAQVAFPPAKQNKKTSLQKPPPISRFPKAPNPMRNSRWQCQQLVGLIRASSIFGGSA